MHVVSFAPGEILSGCCKEASVPFLSSLQVALLCMRTLMALVCLLAGDWDWSSQHLCLVWVQHSCFTPWAPGQAKILCPWGLTGEEAVLSRVSSKQCQDKNSGLLALFSVPAPGWNSYLGSRRGSEKRDGEGAEVQGSNFPSLLDRLFLRRVISA